MVTRSTPIILRDASNVWAWLEREGGINERLYDSELVSELRAALGLSSSGRVAKELRTHDVSVEALIRAFFALAAPFAAMSSDILVMFEKASARRSGANLKIAFNFGKKTDGLKFDICHFRDFIEIFERVRAEILSRDWPRELLWQLYPRIGRSEMKIEGSDLQAWESIYATHQWPDTMPPVPVSGQTELDNLTSAIWPLIEDLVGHMKRFGLPPGRLYSEYHGGRIPAAEIEGVSAGWDMETLVSLDSDFWASSVILSFETLARMLASGEPLSPDLAQWMQHELPKLLNEVRARSSIGETLQSRLEEILNLPVWRQRHQVYSVWVACEILEALGWERLSIYTAEDELRFEFRETHLASTRGPGAPLHVMAELRSPLKAPVGKSRTQSIQPDFRLVGSPIHDVGSHKLVVECKQYLRPSRRNFVDALTDYARGAPMANVVLVNYSDTSEPEITSLVPTHLRARTEIVAPFRPGQPAALHRFRDIVRAVAGHYRDEAGVISDDLLVDLTWADPVDLDLHAVIRETGGGFEHVYYGNRCDRAALARLSDDVRVGPGREQLEISRADPRSYSIFVHNFTGARPIKDTGPVIRLGLGGAEPIVVRPPHLAADAWWVCRLVPATNQIEIINQPCSIDDLERLSGPLGVA